MKMKQKPLWLKWVLCAIPALIAVLMYFILPYFPRFTEYAFTRGIFRVIAFPVEWLMSVIPFSVTEAVVILCVPTLLTLLIIWIVRIIRRPHRRRTIERGCRFVAWCLSSALLIFMVMDGANFSRIPVGE